MATPDVYSNLWVIFPFYPASESCVIVVMRIFKACFWHFRVLLSFSFFLSYLTCFWPLYYLFPLGLFWWYKIAELYYSLITCMCSTGTGRSNIRQQTSMQRTLTEANEAHLPWGKIRFWNFTVHTFYANIIFSMSLLEMLW